MKAIDKIKNIGLKSILIALPLGGVGGGLLASCSDFLDQTSDSVINADEEHLTNASDTLWSVVGIINKMQAIADRTVLLGDVRGDLVDVNSTTSSDLRDLALFNVGTGNAYNDPSDYYAVINNCNYYIAKADTALKNGRNEYIFRKEFAAVKAFRAWTYLQLVLNYGKVPFVTEPILTKDESEKDYPKYDINDICKYFINDLNGLEEVEIPEYGTIRNVDSRLFYFPIKVLMGDLNLWAGNYRDAALWYYRYISTRNGTNSATPTTTESTHWYRSDTHWNMSIDTWASNFFSTETMGNELITLIPGDSIPAEGNYSQLRNIYNPTSDNDYTPELDPSQSIKDLSADQIYCHYTDANNIIYAPTTLEGYYRGDLRLDAAYPQEYVITNSGIKSVRTNSKFVSQHVHIYRLTMVYLRMAEALNRAGFPRFAFQILKTGINNSVLNSEVIPYYPEDEAYLSQFDFPTSQYILRTSSELASENTIGIHSHGSGWSEKNEYYEFPDAEDLEDGERLNYQIEAVEDRIIDEEALEFAFEGYRYYDLIRVAIRRNDPTYLADRVYARRGLKNYDVMKSAIVKDLTNPDNWYLQLPQ